MTARSTACLRSPRLRSFDRRSTDLGATGRTHSALLSGALLALLLVSACGRGDAPTGLDPVETAPSADTRPAVVRVGYSVGDLDRIVRFYFRDPEDHVLELIWYPPDKGQPRWQARDRLFLGIDHTAIGVADTDRSRAFYEDLLGFRKAGESLNFGPEQAALSGVHGARVEITGLAGRRGPGIELLRYLEPGAGRPMPADTRPEDLWHWEIAVLVSRREDVLARARDQGAALPESAPVAPFFLRDPDGHGIQLLAAPP